MRIILLLILLAGCDESRDYQMLEVEKNQPNHKPTIRYSFEDDLHKVQEVCGAGTYCCTKGIGDLHIFVMYRPAAMQCKAHEVDHLAYGSRHVGEG